MSEDAKTWTALVHPGRKMRTRERVAFDGVEAEVIGARRIRRADVAVSL